MQFGDATLFRVQGFDSVSKEWRRKDKGCPVKAKAAFRAFPSKSVYDTHNSHNVPLFLNHFIVRGSKESGDSTKEWCDVNGSPHLSTAHL